MIVVPFKNKRYLRIKAIGKDLAWRKSLNIK